MLFAALHRAGLANQATSVSADDGLEVRHTRIFAAVRCAPPDNKPAPQERDACAPWLHRELSLLRPTLRAVVALGAVLFLMLTVMFTYASRAAVDAVIPKPRPKFGHGARVSLPGVPDLLGCFHVSQQNTFTGRLTPAMLDDVLARAKSFAGLA